MSDDDLALSRRLPWGLLVLALLLPVALAFRDTRRLVSSRAAEAKADALGDFGVVPNFSLTERSGREITRAHPAGAPWIADFIYTSCMGACPLLSGACVASSTDSPTASDSSRSR